MKRTSNPLAIIRIAKGVYKNAIAELSEISSSGIRMEEVSTWDEFLNFPNAKKPYKKATVILKSNLPENCKGVAKIGKHERYPNLKERKLKSPKRLSFSLNGFEQRIKKMNHKQTSHLLDILPCKTNSRPRLCQSKPHLLNFLPVKGK